MGCIINPEAEALHCHVLVPWTTQTPAQGVLDQFAGLRDDHGCPTSEAATGATDAERSCYEYASCAALGQLCVYTGIGHQIQASMTPTAWSYLTGGGATAPAGSASETPTPSPTEESESAAGGDSDVSSSSSSSSPSPEDANDDDGNGGTDVGEVDAARGSGAASATCNLALLMGALTALMAGPSDAAGGLAEFERSEVFLNCRSVADAIEANDDAATCSIGSP
jgi:hypothetical protein